MDFQAIGEEAAKHEVATRPPIAGMHLQYDADFACYEVQDLDQAPASDFQRLLTHIAIKGKLARAEHINAHITLGEKSGREAMATVKIYQGERNPDDPRKVRVRELRTMLANYHGPICTPVYSLNHEADDIMVRYQHARIKTHGWGSSTIMSGDKDLWMGMGQHCDPSTGRIWTVRGFGHCEYRDVGNVKPKLMGEGRSWFWHQMVMGDKADDIPGLEKIHNHDLDVYFPLKSKKPRKDGSGLCGESKAYEVMKGVTTDKEAAHRVFNLYHHYYGRDASERFIEQAYLLWMQRNDNPWDVLTYLHKSCNMVLSPTPRQLQVVKEFKQRCASSSH